MNENLAPIALILNQEELFALTGRRRYRAQSRAFTRMGISCWLRPDGFPIVSRTHFEEIMGAEPHARPSAATDGVFEGYTILGLPLVLKKKWA